MKKISAQKIKAIIKGGKSFCEKSNPKGVCCTEDVKEFLKSHNIEWDNENAKSGMLLIYNKIKIFGGKNRMMNKESTNHLIYYKEIK